MFHSNSCQILSSTRICYDRPCCLNKPWWTVNLPNLFPGTWPKLQRERETIILKTNHFPTTSPDSWTSVPIVFPAIHCSGVRRHSTKTATFWDRRSCLNHFKSTIKLDSYHWTRDWHKSTHLCPPSSRKSGYKPNDCNIWTKYDKMVGQPPWFLISHLKTNCPHKHSILLCNLPTTHTL